MREEIVSVPASVELVPNLAALRDTANAEHLAAEGIARGWLTHALAAGDALLEAWSIVPQGQWQSWMDENLRFSRTTCQIYMRVAMYRSEVLAADASTALDVRTVLSALPSRDRSNHIPPADPALVEQLKQRRACGETWKSLAADIGVGTQTVRRWVDPEFLKNERSRRRDGERKRRARKTEAARASAALERERRRSLVSSRGGDVAKAYAEVRRALDSLERVRVAESDPKHRERYRVAMSHLHRAEDCIVSALHSEPEGKKQ